MKTDSYAVDMSQNIEMAEHKNGNTGRLRTSRLELWLHVSILHEWG